MEDSRRKSSEDLIREARERLESRQAEPDLEIPVDQPHRAAEPARPQEIVYRSQTEPEAEPAKPVPAEEPIQESKSRGRGLLTWAVIILALGAGLVLTRLGDGSRDDTGQIVGAGDVDVLDLRVGDCFNDPEEFEQLVFDVAAVPCAEPHDNEVFAVDSVARVFSDTFPGFAALDDYSFDFCSGDAFENFVGTHYVDSELEVYAFTPSEESWDQDDRGFTCVLYRLDLGKLTGSARGSGL